MEPSLTWKRYDSDTDEINLDKAVGSGDGLLTYAYREIDSPKKQASILTIGSNDGCRVWLNGKQIWDHISGRPALADEDKIPVLLKEGKNSLLIKIENRGRRWAFFCRMLSLQSMETSDNIAQLFQIKLDNDNQPVLYCLYPSLLTPDYLESIETEVQQVGIPNQTAGIVNFTRENNMPIQLYSEGYFKYTLSISASFTGNVIYKQTIPFSSGQRQEYTLFDSGGSNYEIVISNTPSESERWAAQELQHWLMEMSGAFFHIRNISGRQRAKHRIIIGYNPYTQQILGERFKQPENNDESFIYLNVGPDIYIWGGSQRGTMYGVMTFLEREFHCRWYAPNATYIPKKNTFAFDYFAHTESPGIRMRDIDYFEGNDPVWAARNKIKRRSRIRHSHGFKRKRSNPVWYA